MKLVTILGLGTVALMALTVEASAQAYPNELVKIVVPFGAGSVTDTLARILADKLSPMWKQNVIVENRPGLPGTTSVAKSPADGYTLMVTSNGHVIAKTLNKNVAFDPIADFAGITRLVEVPLVMISDAEPSGQDAERVHRPGEDASPASTTSHRPAWPARRSWRAKRSGRPPACSSCMCPSRACPRR